MVLIFLEDFGGHVTDGPASPWSSREFQDLEGACDVRRGSAFLCQLPSTNQQHPTKILTNLPTLQSKLSPHWPILERCGDELFNQGPLPESCPCVPAHAPFRGTDAQEHFLSSSSQSPGTVFWKDCLADLDMDSFCWGSIPSQYRTNGFIHAFSFSSCSHLRAALCVHWSNGTLSRALLRDFGSPGQVERFFSGSPGSSEPWWSCFLSSPRVTPLGLVLSPPSLPSLTVSSSLLSPSSMPLGTGTSVRGRDHVRLLVRQVRWGSRLVL